VSVSRKTVGQLLTELSDRYLATFQFVVGVDDLLVFREAIEELIDRDVGGGEAFYAASAIRRARVHLPAHICFGPGVSTPPISNITALIGVLCIFRECI
jgi:hypothetical protein